MRSALVVLTLALIATSCVREDECPSALAAPLTPQARYVLGEASPYPADLGLRSREDELATNMGARRENGWRMIRAAIEPVEIELASRTAEVPRFATFYDREDLRRVFRHLELQDPETPAPSEAALESAFEWNTRAVRERASWPLSRLNEYEESLSSDERLHGAGGISRVLFDPIAAAHLVGSAREIAACDASASAGPAELAEFRGALEVEARCEPARFGPFVVARGARLTASVTGDALEVDMEGGGSCVKEMGRVVCEVSGPAEVSIVATGPVGVAAPVEVRVTGADPSRAPCLAGPFPDGAAILKAEYRRADFGFDVPVFATDADAQSERLSASSRREFTSSASVVPADEDVYVVELEGGARYRLVALHLMTKELDHWGWATLFWSDDPDGDFGADRPPFPAPFDHYKMCTVTWFGEESPPITGGLPALDAALQASSDAVGSTWCANPYLETGAGNAATNCIGCHQYAGTGAGVGEILGRADGGRELARSSFLTDYVWSASIIRELALEP